MRESSYERDDLLATRLVGLKLGLDSSYGKFEKIRSVDSVRMLRVGRGQTPGQQAEAIDTEGTDIAQRMCL